MTTKKLFNENTRNYFPIISQTHNAFKTVRSKSIGMTGSSSHCSRHSRTICFSGPCCSWETRRGSLDHRRSESCRRVGRMLSFFLCMNNGGVFDKVGEELWPAYLSSRGCCSVAAPPVAPNICISTTREACFPWRLVRDI